MYFLTSEAFKSLRHSEASESLSTLEDELLSNIILGEAFRNFQNFQELN
jgi:hypothetical protein